MDAFELIALFFFFILFISLFLGGFIVFGESFPAILDISSLFPISLVHIKVSKGRGNLSRVSAYEL